MAGVTGGCGAIGQATTLQLITKAMTLSLAALSPRNMPSPLSSTLARAKGACSEQHEQRGRRFKYPILTPQAWGGGTLTEARLRFADSGLGEAPKPLVIILSPTHDRTKEKSVPPWSLSSPLRALGIGARSPSFCPNSSRGRDSFQMQNVLPRWTDSPHVACILLHGAGCPFLNKRALQRQEGSLRPLIPTLSTPPSAR